MACTSPLRAWQCADRTIVWSERSKYDIVRPVELPCGQCIGCRLERSRQWAVRCMHEAQLYEDNCFLTLTYNEEHCPGQLEYRDWQLFFKRLRKRYVGKTGVIDDKGQERFPIRFYMCGEYGEENSRPHFHACVFNFQFRDLHLWKKGKAGAEIYRSKELEELWPYGFATVGQVTFESAAYVARYVMKKVTGPAAVARYEKVNEVTGEIGTIRPEFNKMSLKPGIGAGWFRKYRSDVFPHDTVIVNGVQTKVPKYYDTLEARERGVEFDSIQYDRECEAQGRAHDNTEERLRVKEIVLEAKLNQLYRNKI